MHLSPSPSVNGHFNVLRGYMAPGNNAGVKIVGDFHDNYRQGLPSEFGLLNLFDGATGQPRAVLDATGITEMRTGAVTAVGAKYLAGSSPRILGHIGARGTAYWNVRLLDHLFDFDEIRVHSRRPESRNAFAARLEADLGKPVRVTTIPCLTHDQDRRTRRYQLDQPCTALPTRAKRSPSVMPCCNGSMKVNNSSPA